MATLATAGPPNLPRRPNYRGSNEPTVNAQHRQSNNAIRAVPR
jgi:hypothetical protein